MKPVTIIHTTSVTVTQLTSLVQKYLPTTPVYNFVDDSILPMLLNKTTTMEYVFEKLFCFAQFAQKQGSALILSACSSVGEFCEYAKNKLEIPLLRIDDPVSDIAVERGKNIAVFATLETTLAPSCRLLKGKSENAVITPILVSGAFSASKSGNKTLHDQLIAQALIECSETNDVLYLAQASMADAANFASPHIVSKIVTSTIPAVETLAAMYKKMEIK